ncbi:MAG: hypothetical protein WCI47_01120 [bacterium]
MIKLSSKIIFTVIGLGLIGLGALSLNQAIFIPADIGLAFILIGLAVAMIGFIGIGNSKSGLSGIFLCTHSIK